MPIIKQELPPTEVNPKTGEITVNNTTWAEDDWIRAGRLREKARAGDKKAAKKLEEMENTPMVVIHEIPEKA